VKVNYGGCFKMFKFEARSRKAINTTTGIYVIFRGLYFEPDAEIAQNYGMVINLNRCIGCDSCAVACKQHNGTPKGVFWLKVLRREKGKYPDSWMHFQPMLCMHCQNPECVRVCPTGASHQRDDGIVAIDQDKCIGCQYCILACPYDARTKLVQIEPYYPEKEFMPVEKATYKKHQMGVVGN